MVKQTLEKNMGVLQNYYDTNNNSRPSSRKNNSTSSYTNSNDIEYSQGAYLGLQDSSNKIINRNRNSNQENTYDKSMINN